MIITVTNKQQFSEMLKEVSELDDELSYRRTVARMRNAGTIKEPTVRAINRHTEGEFAYLSQSPASIY